MNEIKLYLEQLNKGLSKHADVKTVFKPAANEEIELKQNVLYNEEMHMKTLHSFVQNIQMLAEIAIEDNEENKGTKEVMAATQQFNSNRRMDINKWQLLFADKDNLLLFIETAAMLTIFCVNCQVTRRISTLLQDDLVFKKKAVERRIYRGQSNTNFKLIPSLYRNLPIDGGFGIVNIKKLEQIYTDTRLRHKYKQVFESDTIDYRFCAFAQHSKAYSPFLDFTYEINVALSFATHPTNSVNDYLKNDAALYSLHFDEIDALETCSLNKIDVFISEKRISPFSIIRNKELFLCTYDDFSVEAYILKDKTNDRMKYQKGCFLYFQKAVIINGNLLLPINFGRIRKYTIPASGNTLTKTKIYTAISENHKCYLQEYLMNPYKYFEEAPI